MHLKAYVGKTEMMQYNYATMQIVSLENYKLESMTDASARCTNMLLMQ